MNVLRINVISYEDGFTRAEIDLGTSSMEIVKIHTAAHDGSEEVKAAFIALATAVMKHIEASIETVTIVEPGAPLDGVKH